VPLTTQKYYPQSTGDRTWMNELSSAHPSTLGASLSLTAAIGLGILTWVLLAILIALLVARMLSLRDR
jgi:hypothetical protein